MKMICDVPNEVIENVRMGTWCGSSVAEKMIANGIPLEQTGKWEFVCQHWRKCSECGFSHKFAEDWKYCPNCGACMKDGRTLDEFIEDSKESDHKCHTCKHYTSGEHDGSCGSYICKGYSNWESEGKE